MSHTLPVVVVEKLQMRRFGVWLAVCFIATVGLGSVRAEAAPFIVRDVQVAPVEGVYVLDARLDVTLPQDALRAIDAGLTLRLSYEIVIDRVRRYMLDAEAAALVQRYEVSYHALSQRYLVRNLNTSEQHDFGSFAAALDRVSELRSLPILDAALLEEGPAYEGRIRAVLDLNTAPDALGWLLFWTEDWSEVSDWATWTLRP